MRAESLSTHMRFPEYQLFSPRLYRQNDLILRARACRIKRKALNWHPLLSLFSALLV